MEEEGAGGGAVFRPFSNCDPFLILNGKEVEEEENEGEKWSSSLCERLVWQQTQAAAAAAAAASVKR